LTSALLHLRYCNVEKHIRKLHYKNGVNIRFVGATTRANCFRSRIQ